MTRRLYDSVTASDIPADAPMVAGYLDGLYRWSAADWARFPHAVKVQIATDYRTNAGQVLDVEQGDATPLQAVLWAGLRRAAGQTPTIYCDEITWPSVQRAFLDAGEPQPLYWIALWDDDPGLLPGAIAKQFANSVHSGGHYDLSIAADSWPGVDSGASDPQNDAVDVQLIKAIVSIAWKAYFGHFPTAAEQQDFDNVVGWSGANGEHAFDQVAGMAKNAKTLADVQRVQA